MGLIDRLRTLMTPVPVEEREMWPYFNYGGNTYPLGLQQTLLGQKEEVGGDFLGLGYGALKANPVVFACMQARASLFSEARFMYRQVRSGTPGELFSGPSLDLLRTPWTGGTTGDLLSRTMQDVDLAGNAFWVRRPGRLVRLRPDWTSFLHGSYNDPSMDMWDPDAELLGYWYQPGGPALGHAPIFYQAPEVAHFAPIPDPIAPHRGMSWLTPLIREVQADSQMTTHKQSFLTQGATVNLVVTGVPGASPDAFRKWVAEFEAGHKGAVNAYKSLYLTPSMDAKAIGSDMQQLDFKAVQGLGETRIAAAAGVPAAVVGISEGLAGSSLNAGNFQAAMRRFADLTMRPLWRNICGSFERIVPAPGTAELWYDDRDIPALKDDIKSYAEVQGLQAQAIRQYVDAGFEPDSVVDSVNAGDLKRLKHSGLYSVQLQLPVPEQPEPAPVPAALVPFTEPDDEPSPEDVAAAKRGADLVALEERRALAEERRADATERMADREPAPPVVNIHPSPVTVTTPDVNVTIERGAVEVSAPVTVEAAQIHIDEGAVRLTEHVATRTVIDRDPETNEIVGSHEEPM